MRSSTDDQASFPISAALQPTLAAARVMAAIAMLAALIPMPAQAVVEGVYVLDGVPQGVAGQLDATPQGSPLDLKLDVSFHRVTEPNALKRYDQVGDRQMVWKVVSDDLQAVIERDIAHVIDGHAQSRIRFPAPGLYHVFADGQPRTLPGQVLRFDITVGDPGDPPRPRALAGPVTSARVGPYQLAFDTLDLKAGIAAHLSLHVTENDKPSRNVRLGGDVGARTLMFSYDELRVVPLAADPAPTPDPSIIGFVVHPEKPGTYRLFVTVEGGRMSFTAPFVVVVRR